MEKISTTHFVTLKKRKGLYDMDVWKMQFYEEVAQTNDWTKDVKSGKNNGKVFDSAALDI